MILTTVDYAYPTHSMILQHMTTLPLHLQKGIEAALRVGGRELLVLALNGDDHDDNSDIDGTGSKSTAISTTAATTATRERTRAIALGADAQALIDAGVRPSNVIIPQSPTTDGIVQCLLALHNPATGTDHDSFSSSIKPTSSAAAAAESTLSSPLSILPLTQHHYRNDKLRILCPIPRVTDGLTEPPVVPNFLKSLRRAGMGDWQVHAVDAYVTKWTGPSTEAARVMNILRRFTINDDDENNTGNDHDNKLLPETTKDNYCHNDDSTVEEQIIVIAISSTAEVEGLLKLCNYYGVNLLESLEDGPSCYFPSPDNTSQGNTNKQDAKTADTANVGKNVGRIRIAAHGPVTARGIKDLLGVHPERHFKIVIVLSRYDCCRGRVLWSKND